MIDFSDTRPAYLRYDLDVLSADLADRAADWIPVVFPKGRSEGAQLRMANIAGNPRRKQGSCVIELKGERAGCWFDHTTGKGGGPLSTLKYATGLRGRDLFAKASENVGAHSAPVGRRTLSYSPSSIKPQDPPKQQPTRPSSDGDDFDQRQALEATAIRVNREIDQAVPLRGTRGELYFLARGLPPPTCSDLRFSEGLADHAAMRGRPGIIALVRAPDGRLLPAIHRTFLRDDCRARAEMRSSKMLLGPARGGVVILAPISPDGVLGLAEGVENAIAAMALYNAPCWSAISAGGLPIFAEALAVAQPRGLKKLLIFADRGVASEEAAEKLYRAAELFFSIAQGCAPLSPSAGG